MRGSPSWLLACVVASVALLTGCPVTPPPDVDTRIEYFVAESTLVQRGAPLSLQWAVLNAAVYEGSPSCSISRRYEGGEPQQPDEVPCRGELTEVPAAPLSAAYVNYQLNVLRRPYDGTDPDPYETRVIRIDLQEPAPDDAQTAIEFFTVDSTTITQGDPVTLSWSVRNPGSLVDAPTCSLTWRYESGETLGPTEVACAGSRQDVPSPPPGASYIRYQLNALKGSLDPDDPYLTAVVTVTILEAPAPEPVVVRVTPKSTTLETGDALSLSATVTGATDTSVSWSASCGTVVPSGASFATFTAPNAPGTCEVAATSTADPTNRDAATVQVVLSEAALSATVTRVEVVRSAYAYPGGISDPFGFGQQKTTAGRCGFDAFGGFGVSDAVGDYRWMCLDWTAQSGTWESVLATILEVRTPAGAPLCSFVYAGTARSARVDLTSCSTAPTETLIVHVGRDDGRRVVFGPPQPSRVLPLITARRPAEGAYYLLANTFLFEWEPQVPLPSSAELRLRKYDVVQSPPGSVPTRGAAWNVVYDVDPGSVTALIGSVPLNDGSHYRWYVRAEDVVDSISTAFSVSDKYRLCRSESSSSSANCSFAFTGWD